MDYIQLSQDTVFTAGFCKHVNEPYGYVKSIRTLDYKMLKKTLFPVSSIVVRHWPLS